MTRDLITVLDNRVSTQPISIIYVVENVNIYLFD